LEISLEAKSTPGTLTIRLIGVIAGYVSSFQIGPISIDIPYGSRIAIMGLNGSGKSTLLKILTGWLTPIHGKVEIGSGIRVGNMMKEHETLPRDFTPPKLLTERLGLSMRESYAKLTKFGLDEKQVTMQIGTLSPGGRARLLLAMFSSQSVNLLVLDEPTNHLDLDALSAIEETVKVYQGTVILVSHDRYFLDKAKFDFTYVLLNGALSRIPDYKTYVAQAETQARKFPKLV